MLLESCSLEDECLVLAHPGILYVEEWCKVLLSVSVCVFVCLYLMLLDHAKCASAEYRLSTTVMYLLVSLLLTN